MWLEVRESLGGEGEVGLALGLPVLIARFQVVVLRRKRAQPGRALARRGVIVGAMIYYYRFDL